MSKSRLTIKEIMYRSIFSFIIYNDNIICNLKPFSIIIIVNLITNKESIYSTIKRTISNLIISNNWWNILFYSVFKTCRTNIKVPSFKWYLNIIIIYLSYCLCLSYSSLLSCSLSSHSLLAIGKACPWAGAAGLILLVRANILFYLIIIQ